MKKTRVAVLLGGNSPEHDISVMTGQEVIKNLNTKKYEVLPIKISKDGTSWQLVDKEKFLSSSFTSKHTKKYESKSIEKININDQLLGPKNIDIVFIALHGPNGEDGKVQSLLELVGLNYTGSDPLSSALAMNKIYSKKLFTQTGLNVPKYEIISRGELPKQKLPIFIKPYNQGSSIGVSSVKKKSQLKKALKYALFYSDPVIAEEAIEGVEITVGILGNDKLKILPPVEIVPKTDFFDYEAKYNESKCEEICPARISSQLTTKSQKAATIAYRTLNCRGFARVDMIIKKNKIFVLEVNTIPGLTPVSLLPKAAKTAGITYQDLLDKIIKYSNP